MFLQNLVHAFICKIRVVFKAYLNDISKSRKYLINTIKHSQYLYFLANSEQKMVKKNKVKKT